MKLKIYTKGERFKKIRKKISSWSYQKKQEFHKLPNMWANSVFFSFWCDEYFSRTIFSPRLRSVGQFSKKIVLLDINKCNNFLWSRTQLLVFRIVFNGTWLWTGRESSSQKIRFFNFIKNYLIISCLKWVRTTVTYFEHLKSSQILVAYHRILGLNSATL